MSFHGHMPPSGSGQPSRRTNSTGGARPRVRPGWTRRRRPAATRPRRDWVAIATIASIAVAGSPGIAALIALIFTFQSVQATNTQLKITEQGQITDRYNAAITNLGSGSIEVRLGGIYALQRLMQDSPATSPLSSPYCVLSCAISPIGSPSHEFQLALGY